MRLFQYLLLSFIVGCTPILNQTLPPGQMRPDGTISPCHGYVMDDDACGAAIWNAKVIVKIDTGQTKAEVRAIMQHNAERREIRDGRESWSYITDYGRELMTTIVFDENGRVIELKQTSWSSD
mgnify:CR=1 FL=1